MSPGTGNTIKDEIRSPWEIAQSIFIRIIICIKSEDMFQANNVQRTVSYFENNIPSAFVKVFNLSGRQETVAWRYITREFNELLIQNARI
jgi:hypothetical protein